MKKNREIKRKFLALSIFIICATKVIALNAFGAVPDDSFEPNDSFIESTDMEFGSYLGLCLLDDDWYKFSVPPNGAITVSVFYDYFAGNIDMELYDASEQRIAFSDKWLVDYELIYYKPTRPGDYYLRIFGFEGAVNYYYDLHAFNPEESAGYSAERIPWQFLDYSESTRLNLGDDDSIEVDMGFSFEFYDRQYSSVRICSNGYLTFGDWGGESENFPMPFPRAPNAIIAAFWDDLVPPETGGGVYYMITGEEGQKSLVVTWADCRRWDFYSLTPGGATFQAILSQDQGAVQFNYQDTIFDDPHYDNGISATVGLENEDGTRCRLFSYNQGVIFSSSSLRFLPYKYTKAGTLWNFYK